MYTFYSIRILPHRQDTGAFFVAVLEKTHHLPWESVGRVEPSGSAGNVESSSIDSAGTFVEEEKLPKRKKRRIQGYKEDPFIFFDDSEPLWPVIKFVPVRICFVCRGRCNMF